MIFNSDELCMCNLLYSHVFHQSKTQRWSILEKKGFQEKVANCDNPVALFNIENILQQKLLGNG